MRPAPKRATSVMRSPWDLWLPLGLGSALQHPLVHRIVPEMPRAGRTGHHVEIIRIVAVGHDYRVIPARDHHDVVILDRHRLVERAVVGIDALAGETLRRVEAGVVRLR